MAQLCLVRRIRRNLSRRENSILVSISLRADSAALAICGDDSHGLVSAWTIFHHLSRPIGSGYHRGDALVGALLANVRSALFRHVARSLAAASCHPRCWAISGLSAGNDLRVSVSGALVVTDSDQIAPPSHAGRLVGRSLLLHRDN